MGLRDIILMFAIYGSIPFIFVKPFVGVLVWYWLGLMNPHRISWTLTNQPFALLTVGVLLVSILVSRKERKYLPWTPIVVTLGAFWLWMLVTTIFAFYPNLAWAQWDKIWKIMLTTYIAIMMLTSKARILALVTVAGISLGFWGVKGGVFTLLSGGVYKVWGPPGSFIGDNNAMALATIMTIPIIFFLRLMATYRILKVLLLMAAILCVFSALGSQSRGALLGLLALAVFFALKSRRKVQYLFLIAILAPVGFLFMPDAWHERMGTIATYEQDGSAMGRIHAWHMAFNLAMHEPLGGGFETFNSGVYAIYLPQFMSHALDAHSIWFEILGEQGFIGLALFLTLGALTFFKCRQVIRLTAGVPERRWMGDLAAMIQASLFAYAVTGSFLGLAYFDYLYLLVALTVGLDVVLRKELSGERGELSPLPDGISVRASPGSQALPEATKFAPSPRQVWRDVTQWYARL